MESPGRTGVPAGVVKVGGSLLRRAEDYEAVARALSPLLASGPLWVVVSAAYGVTDALESLSRGEGEPGAVLSWHARLAAPLEIGADIVEGFNAALGAARSGDASALLAWGEVASAELLRRHLASLGHDVPRVELAPAQPCPAIRHAVVPGFCYRDAHGALRILPRGGSDISAVMVARWCDAREVRLWKEGGGIRLEPGVTVERVDATTLIAWLGNRVRPIHPEAVRMAQEYAVDVSLEDPWGTGLGTHIMLADAQPLCLPVERVEGEASP